MKKLQSLFRVLDRWKWHYLLAGGLLFFSSLVRMLEPKVIQLAVDGVIAQAMPIGDSLPPPDALIRFFYALLPPFHSDQPMAALLSIALLFIVIAVIQSVARFVAGLLSASSTEKAAQRLRNRLFVHIQALSLAQMDKFPKGEMIQRCTGDIDTVRRFLNDQVAELLRLSGILIGSFAMMAMVHLGYALVSTVLFIPMFWISIRFFQRESGIWEQHEKEQDRLTAIIQENLQGIRVVQAFAQEERELQRFIQQNQIKRGLGIQHIDLHSRFWPLADTLCNLQVLVSMVFGAYLALNQVISIGEFAGFFVYVMTMTWPMRQLGQVVSQMGMATVAVQRIQEVLDAEEEDYAGEDYAAQPLRGEIEFRNVSFSYPHDSEGKRALEDVSFHLPAGKRLALMGGTGAGKSTIIALLLRFYEPDSGEILLDGKPLQHYAKTYLRQRFGIVQQKAFLFSSSVRENIRYARPDDEAADFDQVAADAQVHAFVHKLHAGYDTTVGERGVSLSGGQKQRVTIARALLAQPDILVLDDATSAVDTETEFEIQQALQRRLPGKTMIVIAHRLTSTQYADQVLVFEKGKIIERGTPDELRAQDGFYKKVYAIQVAIEEELK